MNAPTELVRQHLIDPEICIRCNTCEETCPKNAITHDSRNYVVRFEACENCKACISPCPTGAIDSYRRVDKARPHAIDEQLTWDTLPQESGPDQAQAAEIPDEVARITEIATAGQGGPALPPWSAAHHIVLDFGQTAFPVLEGQSLGIVAPGLDSSGHPHHVRLYSVASPRNGERPGYNNVALTVKRVLADHDGNPVRGVCSNYVCDLAKGDKVRVVGPYGTSFLMPNHPGSSIMMICTGTGSAPMRAMTERRRRRITRKEGGELALFFGARVPEELPYFGPLMKLPKDFIDISLAFSRVPGQPKRYVQDVIRERADKVAAMLTDENCYIYICGLKGMEAGVNEAFADVCRTHAMDWSKVLGELKQASRYHVETY